MASLKKKVNLPDLIFFPIQGHIFDNTNFVVVWTSLQNTDDFYFQGRHIDKTYFVVIITNCKILFNPYVMRRRTTALTVIFLLPFFFRMKF